jgi:hypothetical protein
MTFALKAIRLSMMRINPNNIGGPKDKYDTMMVTIFFVSNSLYSIVKIIAKAIHVLRMPRK